MSRSCPHCSSRPTTELEQKTILGYRCFRCTSCERQFNERTGSPFNFLGFPTDVVLLVVRWRLPFELSLRDLAEMFLERGFEFTHEAVRAWEERFAPMIGDALRNRRRGTIGCSWYVDETYVKVGGQWCYLYRAKCSEIKESHWQPRGLSVEQDQGHVCRQGVLSGCVAGQR